MKLTLSAINTLRDAKIAKIARMIHLEYNTTINDALIIFMKTKTYELLMDNKSLLYVESTEYVYDMLKNELDGNWDEWLKL